jgi:4-hydroxy 2-oxovalerate aldolase
MSHPNYAYFLSNKRTLTLEAMDEIFELINLNKRYEYDEKYIEQLYIDYLSRRKGKEFFENLMKNIAGKDILLIAPGASAYGEKEKINSFICDNSPMVISINFCYPYANPDYVFVSNMRRFRQLDASLYYKTIVTSNIKMDEVFATVDYESLLNSIDMVRDNACLMAMRLFADNYLSSIYIAGLDGYSRRNCDYAFENLTIPSSSLGLSLEKINSGIAKFMSEFSEEHNIYFLTSSIFAN